MYVCMCGRRMSSHFNDTVGPLFFSHVPLDRITLSSSSPSSWDFTSEGLLCLTRLNDDGYTRAHLALLKKSLFLWMTMRSLHNRKALFECATSTLQKRWDGPLQFVFPPLNGFAHQHSISLFRNSE